MKAPPPLAVLALDTSTECCSAAVLCRDGRLVLRSAMTERSHAELILPMIDEVLREAGLSLAELDGLAFGRGPGGFTGLRIAAGVAQGLAYGAGLRVAPVSSLAAVALLTHLARSAGEVARSAGEGVLTSPASAGEVARSAGEGPDTPSPARCASDLSHEVGEVTSLLVCNDARMNELYWACYRVDAGDPCTPVELSHERVGPESSVVPAAGVDRFAGNGVARYPALRERLEAAGLRFHEGVYPRADAVALIGAAMLARGEGVDAAHALPTYVRDDVARASPGPVTGMS